jgi:hypothetical protein
LNRVKAAKVRHGETIPFKTQTSPDINNEEVKALPPCATLITAVLFNVLLIGPATTGDATDSEAGGEPGEDIWCVVRVP